jgi:hypothetical protein
VLSFCNAKISIYYKNTGTDNIYVKYILSQMWMFRTAINKLFEWLLSRVLASQRGGLGSIPGRDMSVLGTLVEE